MRIVRWLIALLDVNPLKSYIALLLIALFSLSGIIRYQEKRIRECADSRDLDRMNYYRKTDSLMAANGRREIERNEEMRETLQTIIEGYKKQLADQGSLNERLNNTVNRNKSIINNNNNQLKILENEHN